MNDVVLGPVISNYSVPTSLNTENNPTIVVVPPPEHPPSTLSETSAVVTALPSSPALAERKIEQVVVAPIQNSNKVKDDGDISNDPTIKALRKISRSSSDFPLGYNVYQDSLFYTNHADPDLKKVKDVKDTNFLPKSYGFTGLTNYTGNCGINAGLQALRAALLLMLEHESGEEKQHLETVIKDRTPELWKFLNGECNTELDCRMLRREMAINLTKDSWYSSFTQQRISEISRETGHFHGFWPGAFVRVLLHELKAPQLYFEQVQKSSITGLATTTHHRAQTLSFERSSRWMNKMQQDVIDYNFSQRGYLLEDPVPAVLMINARPGSRFVSDDIWTGNHFYSSGITKPVTFPYKDGSRIIYEPKAIMCLAATYKNSLPHGCTYVKKEGRWYELNDHFILPILKDWEEDFDAYCARFGELVVYQKSEENNNVSQVPNQNVAIQENSEDYDVSEWFQQFDRCSSLPSGTTSSYIAPYLTRVFHSWPYSFSIQKVVQDKMTVKKSLLSGYKLNNIS